MSKATYSPAGTFDRELMVVPYSDYAALQAQLTEAEEKINILQGAYEKEQVKRMAAEERERVLLSELRSIRYHAQNGHQDRPGWKRLNIISEISNRALSTEHDEEG